MLKMMQAIGWPMYGLFVLSIIAMALIIERLLYLRRSYILPSFLLEEVMSAYQQGQVDVQVMSVLANNSLWGQVLAAGLQKMHASREMMKEAMEEAGRTVAQQLKRFLSVIGTLVVAAPLLGVLGTLMTMSRIFNTENLSVTSLSQLAPVFSVALYPASFGLIIAIICLVFYRYFISLANALIFEMEHQGGKLIDSIKAAHN